MSAFCAIGGNNDKSGEVCVQKLTNSLYEFGLTIDIQRLINEIDEDGNGTVDFDEFSKLLH